MRIDILTLFPEVFEPYFGASIIGRAVASGRVRIAYTNYREFTHDRHRTVDDKPFSGGPGMVLKCGPVFDAVEHVCRADDEQATMVLLTPQGERLNQRMVEEFARAEHVVLVCGHYEGFDERIRIGLGAREVSIGDYVLSGGEPAAMVLVDAIVRLLPGALGDAESSENDSFSDGLLEHPQYTRPRVYRGMEVPEVLLSGHHAEIEAWRRSESLKRTKQRRPDLLDESEPATES